MTEHVKEDFCVSCAVAAGALFAGGASVSKGVAIEEEDEVEDTGVSTKDFLIWGGVLLLLFAIIAYFYGAYFLGCSTCA